MDLRRFTASDGYAFAWRHWRPERAPPAGYLVALHGIQSHSGWYGYSCGRLCRAGYDVRFLDRRGSGLNEKDRGHAVHHERLLSDVVQFLGAVRLERDCDAPAAPLVLTAVSWGARPAAVLAARRPELIDALALLYPGLCARIRPGHLKKAMLRLAGRLGADRRQVPIPLDDPALFTDNEDARRFIRDDPLALHRASVRFLIGSLELEKLAGEAPERIARPVLMMLAGRDRIIDNAATRRWFERIASPAKRLIEYPAAAHTLEFEPDRDAIIDELIGWLSRLRCATSRSQS